MEVSNSEAGRKFRPHLATGAEKGLGPTPETIQIGTVQMEAHPRYAQEVAELANKGFRVEHTSGSPHVSVVEVVSQGGEVLRVERIVYVTPKMRFLDFEHEIGHVRQFTERLQNRLLPTERVLEDGRKVTGKVFTSWMDAITEYHNRLEEYLRLVQNGASRDLLKKHAEGVRKHRLLYRDKGLKGRRSPSQMEWGNTHFPDIPELEAAYGKAGGRELE
jgi:hypothetical protein